MWHRVLFIIRITPTVQTSVDTKIAKLAFTSQLYHTTENTIAYEQGQNTELNQSDRPAI